ncbi:MAG: hypothetical protein EZS28_031871 [Streblomastix strix]|uniref:Uncharacterized protein n=1 Tax=Streblomastix strix TaxID=222440 RepID=A0A5J4UR69_9EUKA|nr:MAG: hypothetical protein EZS28_031871 [Streblomastix strix]
MHSALSLYDPLSGNKLQYLGNRLFILVAKVFDPLNCSPLQKCVVYVAIRPRSSPKTVYLLIKYNSDLLAIHLKMLHFVTAIICIGDSCNNLRKEDSH